jgi:hypothetical protein
LLRISLITPWKKYKLLQRGFLTLELKYNRRKEKLTQLRKELQVQAEGHTLRTNELIGEIGAKEGKLEELRGEFKNVAQATRAVKGIVGQVRGTGLSDFHTF